MGANHYLNCKCSASRETKRNCSSPQDDARILCLPGEEEPSHPKSERPIQKGGGKDNFVVGELPSTIMRVPNTWSELKEGVVPVKVQCPVKVQYQNNLR